MDYTKREKDMKLFLIVIVNNLNSDSKYLMTSLNKQAYKNYELIM